MRAVMIATTVAVLTAVPLFAQESGGQNANGYVSAFGGAAWTAGDSTSSVVFEGGGRIAPHLMVFTNVGRFSDLKADLEPTLDATTTALSNQGLALTGGGTLPTWYGVGGLRAEIFASKRALPYVLGGLGAARLNPKAKFLFSSGIMPDGSVPSAGADVTTALASGGSFTAPSASTAFMLMLGGGVQVPLVPHWVADVGYHYGRIAADTTLNAQALNTNATTFGFGYRF